MVDLCFKSMLIYSGIDSDFKWFEIEEGDWEGHRRRIIVLYITVTVKVSPEYFMYLGVRIAGLAVLMGASNLWS